MLKELLARDAIKQHVLAVAYVVPSPGRCVQCGICSYNCPLGVDVREFASRGASLSTNSCLTCGECVARCPRGVLSLQSSDLFLQK